MPVEPPAEMVERLRAELPESPSARIARLGERARPRARARCSSPAGSTRLYEATVAAGAERVAAANVIANNLVGAGVDPSRRATPASSRSSSRRATGSRARCSTRRSRRPATPGFAAAPYLAQEAVSDASELDPVIDAIIAANPGQVAAFKGGKEGLLGFFVGQVMKETGGTANPRVVSELVRAKLQLTLAGEAEALASPRSCRPSTGIIRGCAGR